MVIVDVFCCCMWIFFLACDKNYFGTIFIDSLISAREIVFVCLLDRKCFSLRFILRNLSFFWWFEVKSNTVWWNFDWRCLKKLNIYKNFTKKSTELSKKFYNTPNPKFYLLQSKPKSAIFFSACDFLFSFQFYTCVILFYYPQ